MNAVLICFCALPLLNCVPPAVKCSRQGDPCEAITALESGEESHVRNLHQWMNITLDPNTLSAFPVLRSKDIVLIDIAKEIWSNHSETFGMELLGNEDLEKIDEIIHNNPESANVRIILRWFSGKGKKPITCKTFVNVLHKIGFNELANEIETTCNLVEIMDKEYKPKEVQEYSQLLTENYEKDAVIDSTLWLPRRLHGRNITFVDLEFKEEGRAILLFDLLDNIQSGTRILFLGRPGVGKTTLTRHLSKVLIHTLNFFLVIKVHIGVADTIDSLDALLTASLRQANAYEYFDSDDISVISKFVSRKVGEGVCFLVDGFDEYDGSGYIASLVRGNVLAKSVVIVTSRPSAAEDIKSTFHRMVEIIGFGEKSIKIYLEQLRLSQADNQPILQYLDTHPNVRQLCYLPLHLSMLVYVAVVTGELTVVDTETRLYSDFLYLTIKQYESIKHEQTVKSLKECFDDIHRETVLCILLEKFMENAFNGLMSNRDQTFDSSSFEGLPNGVNISAEIEALSLFKIESFYDRRGNKLQRYYYSHPTFQEYLAAFYLTTLPQEEQLNYVKHHFTHEVYKFFLGLIGSELNLKYNDEAVSQLFVSYAREDLATYQNQELHIMKCAHEVGRGARFTTFLEAAGVITSNNSVQVYADYNHDCWYVGYTLTRSPLYKLTVDKHSDLGLCLSYISKYFNHDSKIMEGINVTKLVLGSYDLWFAEREDPTSTTEILEFMPAFQNDLTHLELMFLKFEHGASVLQLGETLKSFRKLQSLALSVNISVITEGHLESALRDLTHLEHLELGVINKHDDDTTIPDNLLEFNGLEQLQSLTLCISWNKDIVDVNLTALIGGLECLTKLKSLTIRMMLYSGFRNNGATELLQGIVKVSAPDLSLYLDVCWEYGLGNVSIEELSAIFKDLMHLKKLTLCIDFNFSDIQGHNGLMELTEGLKGLSELHELSLELRWELLTDEAIDEAAIALVNSLKNLQDLSLLELNLKQNGSCSEIAQLFKSLTQLKELKLKWKSFGGKTDVEKLINGLQHLRQLRKLDLSWNDMGDDDMVPLFKALEQVEHLEVLDLSHNKIGDSGLQILAQTIELQSLSNLQVLLLNQNEFSGVGADILSQKLANLSNLHTLDFGLTHGTYSAQALVQIYQQKATQNPVLPSIASSDEATSDSMSYVGIATAICISTLVGGFLLYFGYKSTTSSSQMPKGISENLALGTFSASFAWNLEKLKNQGLDGTGTVMVILDTAIDLNCPAYRHKNIPVIDCLPQLPITSIDHGSVCASVAVGLSCPSTPTTPAFASGVAPGAKLIIYRIAEGGFCYNEAILTALGDIKKKIESGTAVDVVSISYDLSEDCAEEIHGKIKSLTEDRVVFVAAVGNRGRFQPHASIPACFRDCVISVGALDKDGYDSRFNARGHIDVSAPGEKITIPLSSSKFKGTSFATPAIGGLVLLLKQCANLVGPPASDNIHRVEVLRSIFAKHMTTKSDSGEVLLDPAGFLQRVLNNPSLLKEIVAEHMDTAMEQ